MTLAIVFAVASAFSNAVTVIAQHLASVTAPRREKGWRLVGYLIRQPTWLLGGAAGVAAFAFQAVALHFGLLSVVQPLLLTELVFVLVLRRVWIGQQVTVSAWAAAAVSCVALAVFLAMAEPTGGSASPSAGDWLAALIATGGAIALLSAAGTRGSPVFRAAVYAIAGSLAWALMATFIKAAVQTLAASGFTGFLESWSPYALAAAAISGTLLEQTALHVGPLNVSEPILVVVNPLASIGLSVWVFGEHFTAGSAKIALATVAFIVMIVAVIELARWSPRTITPERGSRPAGLRASGDPAATGRNESAGTDPALPQPQAHRRRTRGGSPPAPPGTHRSA
jgi:drug/metabolite transporter (DMT)-like permease